MIQPVDLTAHPSITHLVEKLPKSSTRDDLAATYQRRTEQFREVLEHLASLAGRIDEISELLPDTPQDKKSPLINERMRLQSQQLAASADRRVGARLYAEAMQEWAGHVVACVHTELRKVAAELQKTDGRYVSVRNFIDRTPAGDPRFAERYAELHELEAQRRPHMDRRDDLKQLHELLGEHVTRALRVDPHQHIKVRDGKPLGDLVAPFVNRAATEEAA